jgi:hypothetical protein
MEPQHSEKAAMTPPLYSPTSMDAPQNSPSGYPPNLQSPAPTGMLSTTMHAVHTAQNTSPMSTPGLMQAFPQQAAMSPANLEAQLGHQYQSQSRLFSYSLQAWMLIDTTLHAVLARCARGEHDVVKRYGPCGIITAVLLFPIGLIALLYVLHLFWFLCD